ncbi:T9SS type A sorting domain-containing protein, partial [Flavobacteriaceae bacterium XHP0103]|uniref:T9SS type A sorting domain-containing protein n=1 Tax=Marixanthotalea marina TaxID=2844359 RepID=UPI002989CE82
TGPGGTGTPLSAGDKINTTQTIYVFTPGSGSCPDAENSFLVTINDTPMADDPGPAEACDEYTLPALTNGNYFTGPGGTGTPLSAGDKINTTQTIYVFTPGSGSCPDAENSFLVTIHSSVEAGTGGNLPAFCQGDFINGGAVDLTALLTGADPEGTWTDLDGAGVNLTDPTSVDFTSVASSLTPYRFKYTVYSGNTCPDDEAIVTVTVQNCIVDCGTAFGVAINEDGTVNDDMSRCFLNDKINRWGWTNFIADFGTYTLELYQGAGKCDLNKGTYVGTVTITYEQIGDTPDGNVNVVYDMAPGYGLDEVHLYIGCNMYPSYGKGNKPSVAPGQYTFVAGGLEHADIWTTDDASITASGGFYVIAHSVACGEDIPEGSFIPTSPMEHGSFIGGMDEDCDVEVAEESPKGGKPKGSNGNSKKSSSLSFNAYPVPFDQELTVSYKFDYNTKVNIDVYDAKGSLIKQVVDTEYVKGTLSSTKLDIATVDDQLFFVRVTTNEGTLVKKVISSSSK